jgi:hypothetical protein
MQQFELAIMLRRLWSRFKHGSTEYDILRMVSRGARQRATKLKDLLREMDSTLPKRRNKRPGFLVRGKEDQYGSLNPGYDPEPSSIFLEYYANSQKKHQTIYA